jgi:hypothetical protein
MLTKLQTALCAMTVSMEEISKTVTFSGAPYTWVLDLMYAKNTNAII